jgi:hypothetical protein
VADHGILFQDHMVQEIESNRKDVTRRLGERWARVQPGHRLWVRQAWRPAQPVPSHGLDSDCRLAYRSDYPPERHRELGPWRPGIHLPRWGARTLLQVVSVHEQAYLLGGGLGQMAVLLPDVDDDEARREGFGSRREFLDLWRVLHPEPLIGPPVGPVYRIEFEVLRG